MRRLRELSRQPGAGSANDWLAEAAAVAEYSLGHLRAADQEGLWIDVAAAPEPVQKTLAAYDAAARRDYDEMLRAGQAALLALDSDAPQQVREHLLMIALLGAHVSKGSDAAAEVERAHGALVPAGGSYGLARAFLLAWADGKEKG